MDAGSSGVGGEQARGGEPQQEQQSPALCRHTDALAGGRSYGSEELLCMRKVLTTSSMAYRRPAAEPRTLLARIRACQWPLLWLQEPTVHA